MSDGNPAAPKNDGETTHRPDEVNQRRDESTRSASRPIPAAPIDGFRRYRPDEPEFQAAFAGESYSLDEIEYMRALGDGIAERAAEREELRALMAEFGGDDDRARRLRELFRETALPPRKQIAVAEEFSRLQARREAQRILEEVEREQADASAYVRLDLKKLLTEDRPRRGWVVEGFIAENTSNAIVAPAGRRKSLVTLALAVAIASGSTFAGTMDVPRARRVFYVDMELTDDDVEDRLRAFGLGPGASTFAALDNLVYINLPPIAPLDTARGGADLLAALDVFGIGTGDVVVLDSYQRVTQAGENDSDTTRGFYRHTGVHLKAREVTVIRLDNTGKDVEKGARGSSAKIDDVDVEWRFSSSEKQPGLIALTLGKVRQRGLTPFTLEVRDDEGGVTTLHANPSAVPEETDPRAELAAWLDEQGVPVSTGEDKVWRLVKDAGRDSVWRRNSVVRPVVKRRKQAADEFAVEDD